MAEVTYDKTVADGELFKWEKVGAKVEGVLLSYTFKKDTGKGDGHVYEVETANGVAAFFAPTILQKKLSRIPTGSLVKCTLSEIGKTTTGNTLKHFVVDYIPATETAKIEAACKTLGIELMTRVEDDDEDEITGEEV